LREIRGNAKTVRELLSGSKYAIDFYQREFKWTTKQVQELLDDLANKFLEDYEPDHERSQVEKYGHYFLGSIIISDKEGQKYIIDGQQRLTTMTLLLIYLHNLQIDRPAPVIVSELIFSEKYSRRSFNIDVSERTPCMEALFTQTAFDENGQSESVRNISSGATQISSPCSRVTLGTTLCRILSIGLSKTCTSLKSQRIRTRTPTRYSKR
jgi:hypothetical protein